MDEDEQLALLLQEEYFNEMSGGSIGINEELTNFLPTESQLKNAFDTSPYKKSKKNGGKPDMSIVAPEVSCLLVSKKSHKFIILLFSGKIWTQIQIYTPCFCNTTNSFSGVD